MTERRNILVVDDEPALLELSVEILEETKDFRVHAASSCEEAIRYVKQNEVDLLLTDLSFPDGMGGIELMQYVTESSPTTDIIVVTGQGTIESAIHALRLGAFDYIIKPYNPEELVSTVRRVFSFRDLVQENQLLRNTLAEDQGKSHSFIGSSKAVQGVMERVRAVAKVNSTVLIRGESGVGKEVIANEIHRLGPRKDGPMIKINCAALPDSLLEDELFGHEKGAFTGAEKRRIGRFEEAKGGTIFLDEIGEMKPLLQAKLLRILQEGTFQRVGSNSEIHSDARVICATNSDLETMVATGAFREDLYYRIKVVEIAIPPLRERPEDIPLLAEALGKRIAMRLGVANKRWTRAALLGLQQLPFPGNVRELMNLIERVLIFTPGAVIDVADVEAAATEAAPSAPIPAPSAPANPAAPSPGAEPSSPNLEAGVVLPGARRETDAPATTTLSDRAAARGKTAGGPMPASTVGGDGSSRDLPGEWGEASHAASASTSGDEAASGEALAAPVAPQAMDPANSLPLPPPGAATLAEIERHAVRQALEETDWNMYRAAKLLDISRSTLYSKVKKFDLQRTDASESESEATEHAEM